MRIERLDQVDGLVRAEIERLCGPVDERVREAEAANEAAHGELRKRMELVSWIREHRDRVAAEAARVPEALEQLYTDLLAGQRPFWEAAVSKVRKLFAGKQAQETVDLGPLLSLAEADAAVWQRKCADTAAAENVARRDALSMRAMVRHATFWRVANSLSYLVQDGGIVPYPDALLMQRFREWVPAVDQASIFGPDHVRGQYLNSYLLLGLDPRGSEVTHGNE